MDREELLRQLMAEATFYTSDEARKMVVIPQVLYEAVKEALAAEPNPEPA